MNCRKCEEIVANAAREGTSRGLAAPAAAHMAVCASCREFGAAMSVAAAALDRWSVSESARDTDVARAALVARLGAAPASDERPGLRIAFTRWTRQPALIGVLGAAAAGAGAWISPGWAQQAIGGWAAGAAVLASLVLLCHGRPAIIRGEFR